MDHFHAVLIPKMIALARVLRVYFVGLEGCFGYCRVLACTVISTTTMSQKGRGGGSRPGRRRRPNPQGGNRGAAEPPIKTRTTQRAQGRVCWLVCPRWERSRLSPPALTALGSSALKWGQLRSQGETKKQAGGSSAGAGSRLAQKSPVRKQPRGRARLEEGRSSWARVGALVWRGVGVVLLEWGALFPKRELAWRASVGPDRGSCWHLRILILSVLSPYGRAVLLRLVSPPTLSYGVDS